MKAVLTHLSGPLQGEIRSVAKSRFVVAPGPSNTVSLDEEQEGAAWADVHLDNCEYYLRDRGTPGGIFVNSHQVGEVILQEGDVLEFGPGGPKILFRLEADEGEVCKPLRIVCRDCIRKAGRFGQSPLEVLRAVAADMPRALLRETTPAARSLIAGTLLLATVSLVVSAGVLVLGTVSRRRVDAELARVRVQLSTNLTALNVQRVEIATERRKAADLQARRDTATTREIEALREEERKLRAQLDDAQAGSSVKEKDLEVLKKRLTQATEKIVVFESDRSLAERIIREKGPGVAFLEGSYVWEDLQGRPLRVLEAAGGTPTEGRGGPATYATSGSGPVLRLVYTGTGFLVSKAGHIFTNRHVAEPWWHGRETKELVAGGFHPRLEGLRAYFPGLPASLPLELVRVSEKADVALLRTDFRGAAPQVLQIEEEPGAVLPGQPVILLGYPTGLDALLARLDEGVVDSIVAAVGTDVEKFSEELARRRMIRPLATQGHLGDVLPHQITYDALTTVGGSGGPVFNRRGRVIGVNAAILRDFSGASFGVPIRFGRELLPDEPGAAGARKGVK